MEEVLDKWQVWESYWVAQIVEEVKLKMSPDLLVTIAFYPDFMLPDNCNPGINFSGKHSRWYSIDYYEDQVCVSITMHPRLWRKEFIRGPAPFMEHMAADLKNGLCISDHVPLYDHTVSCDKTTTCGIDVGRFKLPLYITKDLCMFSLYFHSVKEKEEEIDYVPPFYEELPPPPTVWNKIKNLFGTQ
jgi:hypothetical protein